MIKLMCWPVPTEKLIESRYHHVKLSTRMTTAQRCGMRRPSLEHGSMPAPRQSVERRSSGAPSDCAGSDLVSDLTGSIPVRSTCGVSTRIRDASAERVCSGGRSERGRATARSEEHTSELQSLAYLVCRLLLEKKKQKRKKITKLKKNIITKKNKK